MSIFTCAECCVSTLPALSVDHQVTVCTPSLLPSAGAATVTVVPLNEPPWGPSTVHDVLATPEPSSLGLSVTVTGVVCQAESKPSAVVTGGVRSILAVEVLATSTLPLLSVER